MKKDAQISSIYFFISLIKQTSSMPRAAAGRQGLFEPSSPEMLKPGGKHPSLCVAPGPGSPFHPAQRLGPRPSRRASRALKPAEGWPGSPLCWQQDCRCCLCCVSPSDLPLADRLVNRDRSIPSAQPGGWGGGVAIKAGSFADLKPSPTKAKDSILWRGDAPGNVKGF